GAVVAVPRQPAPRRGDPATADRARLGTARGARARAARGCGAALSLRREPPLLLRHGAPALDAAAVDARPHRAGDDHPLPPRLVRRDPRHARPLSPRGTAGLAHG